MTVDSVLLSGWSSPMFLLILFRLGGLFLSAPIFAGGHVPVVFKAGLALGLAVSLYPLLGKNVVLAPEMEPWSLGLSIVGEVAIGVAIGLAARLLFVGVSLAGELAGTGT